MNPRPELGPLTFGGCIASVCRRCGVQRAIGILRFSVNANILRFPGLRHVEFAPDGPRAARSDSGEAASLIRYFMEDARRQPVVRRKPGARAAARGRAVGAAAVLGR